LFVCAAVGILATISFGLERLEASGCLGWASVIVTLLVVSGLQLVAIRTIGEYLGRLFLSSNGTRVRRARADGARGERARRR
jgi:hypothetical protein